ncbi:MAG: triose-phosphate isomerase [Anaerolineales bacterium]|nr:triose-phosphate isomerase [Anaerolineales bacterium]
MRHPIVVGNWKMNMSIDEGLRLVSSMMPGLDAIEGVDKIICPPFLALAPIGDILSETSVSVGAQNMHYEENGAFTGEISPVMLSSICKFVIVGHSERRQLFGENDDSVNKKVLAAHKVGMKPIVCVGEQLNDRNADKAKKVVGEQVIRGLVNSDEEPILVAYEPVWAIGTGMAATTEIVEDMMSYLRGVIRSSCGPRKSEEAQLLYGGSVNPANIGDFMALPDVDGALVGGASLDPKAFDAIVNIAAESAK